MKNQFIRFKRELFFGRPWRAQLIRLAKVVKGGRYVEIILEATGRRKEIAKRNLLKQLEEQSNG